MHMHMDVLYIFKESYLDLDNMQGLCRTMTIEAETPSAILGTPFINLE